VHILLAMDPRNAEQGGLILAAMATANPQTTGDVVAHMGIYNPGIVSTIAALLTRVAPEHVGPALAAAAQRSTVGASRLLTHMATEQVGPILAAMATANPHATGDAVGYSAYIAGDDTRARLATVLAGMSPEVAGTILVAAAQHNSYAAAIRQVLAAMPTDKAAAIRATNPMLG
jgi:hypothetical protein